MTIIALFAVLFFTVSSRIDRDYRASVGFESPELLLEGVSDGLTIDLNSLKGRYVLVNFWAAYDAESRLMAHEFESIADRFDSEQLCLLQVNLDQSKRLFREIVRRDKMDAAHQFTVRTDQAGDVKHMFNLESGLQSYLIAPDGKIAAVNPTAAEVKDLITT